MYSGFVTHKRVVKRLGIHQKFDMAAFRMAAPYFYPETFPTMREILHFEGINGPDGLKIKAPGEDADHLYNPATGRGAVPRQIENHYRNLVATLKAKDLVRAAFEAAWVAHFICDGFTPAHQFPLAERLAELKNPDARQPMSAFVSKGVIIDKKLTDTVRKNWAIWGRKGLLSLHFNFEMGVVTTLWLSKIKDPIDITKLAEARRLGPVKFFKQEAKEIAGLELYEEFHTKGWNTNIAWAIRRKLAPRTAQTIAIVWLLAYLEAGQELAAEANVSQ